MTRRCIIAYLDTIENQHFIRDGVMGKAFVSHETAPVRLLGANCYDWLL